MKPGILLMRPLKVCIGLYNFDIMIDPGSPSLEVDTAR